MNLLKAWAPKVGGALLIMGAVLGWKFYQRSASASETKAELERVCAGEASCLEALKTHFDACHDEAFDLGGRRRAGGLNQERLASCINRKAGGELFSVGP